MTSLLSGRVFSTLPGLSLDGVGSNERANAANGNGDQQREGS